MRTCTNCNAVVENEQMKFCPQCGHALEETPAPSAPTQTLDCEPAEESKVVPTSSPEAAASNSGTASIPDDYSYSLPDSEMEPNPYSFINEKDLLKEAKTYKSSLKQDDSPIWQSLVTPYNIAETVADNTGDHAFPKRGETSSMGNQENGTLPNDLLLPSDVGEMKSFESSINSIASSLHDAAIAIEPFKENYPLPYSIPQEKNAKQNAVSFQKQAVIREAVFARHLKGIQEQRKQFNYRTSVSQNFTATKYKLEQEISKLRTDVEKFNQNIKDLRPDLDRATSEYFDLKSAHDSIIKPWKEEYDSEQVTLNNLEWNLKKSQEKVRSLEEAIDGSKATIAECKSIIKDSESTIRESERIVDSANMQINQAQESLYRAEDRKSQIEQRLWRLDMPVPSDPSYDRMRDRRDRLQGELDNATETVFELNNKIDNLHREISKAKDDDYSAKQRIRKAESDLRSAEKALDEAESELPLAKDNLMDAKSEVEDQAPITDRAYENYRSINDPLRKEEAPFKAKYEQLTSRMSSFKTGLKKALEQIQENTQNLSYDTAIHDTQNATRTLGLALKANEWRAEAMAANAKKMEADYQDILQANKKRSRRLIIGVVSGAVVAIAIIALLVFASSAPKQSTTSSYTSQKQTSSTNANPTSKSTSTSSRKTEEPDKAKEEKTYKTLLEYWERLGEIDQEIKENADYFNKYYLTSSSKRLDYASQLESHGKIIRNIQDELEELKATAPDSYKQETQELIDLYEDCFHRATVINEAWNRSLEFSDPSGHDDYICEPLAQDNVNGKNKYAKHFNDNYEDAKPHKPE